MRTYIHTTKVIPKEAETLTQERAILRFTQVIWFICGISEIILGFRFGLKILGASAYSGFSLFIYTLSYPFVRPFQGIVREGINGIYVVEWSTLIAMAAYFVVAYILIALLQLLKPVSREEIEQEVTDVTQE